MERFTASERPTVESCERSARECDIYVGIVAHRYGWIPDGQEVSITELEYNAAKKAGRPRLMFEIAPGPVEPDKDFDSGAAERRAGGRTLEVEEYESLRETIEVLADPKILRALKTARRGFARRRTLTQEHVWPEK